jgi:hypothetical protein
MLAYPALGGSFLVNPRSDQYLAGYAFREFAARSLQAGHGFPQWNPYLFGGLPYIGAMHGDIFYPTFLLRMMMGADSALTWSFVIHLFLAGFFTFGFLRAWGVSFFGALIGGLAYMLSGPIAGYASPGHDGKLYVSALIPLGLLLLVRGVRDKRPWAWGVFALVVALAALSPHPQLLQYFLIVCGFFTLYLAFSLRSGETLDRSAALARIGLAFGSVAIGLVASAVQYVPALIEYKPWSPRAPGHDYATAVSFSMPPEELLNTVVPQFSGILDAYWGRNGLHYHSEYAGVSVLVLATLGAFASTERKSFRWFWLAVLGISILWALGGYTPFFQLVYYGVPYTKYLRAPSMMMVVSMFSLTVLAAVGVDRALRDAWSKRALIGPAALGVLCLLLASPMTVSIADAVGDVMARTYQGFQASQMGQMARDNSRAVIVGAFRSLIFLGALTATVWLLQAGRISRRWGAVGIAALVALDLWTVERQYWLFSRPANELYASDASVRAVASDTEPGRVLAIDPLRSSIYHDPSFVDGWMVHGVRSMTGYHGNELGRYQKLLDAGGGLSPQLLRHENVRYLYTTVPDSLMPRIQAQLQMTAPFTKVVGPVKNTAGSTVYVYRVPGRNPAAWVASSIVKGSDEQALATILNPLFDPLRAAIVDTSATVQAVPPASVPASSTVTARVTRYEPGSINVELDQPVPAGTALVVSENYFPGWSATVGTTPAPVTRANYNLIGVALPAGARAIQLRFTDIGYERGKTITLAAFLVIAIAIGAGVVVGRRDAAALSTVS